VLRRPADSRSRDDGATQSSRPPVLRRSTDAQSDEGGSSGAVGRPSSSGQQQGAGGQQQQPGGEGDVIKLESTLINLPILVSDRSGRYVPQLSARDFVLYEDGVQQTIARLAQRKCPSASCSCSTSARACPEALTTYRMPLSPSFVSCATRIA